MRQLPKMGVKPEAFELFPLILPEPDAGRRKGLDEVLRSHGMLGKLEIALEVGGWGTILQYVADGVGVGLVSEGALGDVKGLIVCGLPGVFSSERSQADLPLGRW